VYFAFNIYKAKTVVELLRQLFKYYQTYARTSSIALVGVAISCCVLYDLYHWKHASRFESKSSPANIPTAVTRAMIQYHSHIPAKPTAAYLLSMNMAKCRRRASLQHRNRAFNCPIRKRSVWVGLRREKKYCIATQMLNKAWATGLCGAMIHKLSSTHNC